MIKKVLLALCALVGVGFLCLVLLFGGMYLYQRQADTAAMRIADAFCRQTPIGSNADLVAGRAEKIQHMHHLLNDNDDDEDNGRDGLQLVVQGGIHHAAVCVIDVANGKVTAAKTHPEES